MILTQWFSGYVRRITGIARILQWGGSDNDVTFNRTLYTRADPESFSWGDVILNSVEY